MSRAFVALTLVATACSSGTGGTGDRDADVVLTASEAELVATLDERFQSFNVEMVEVTGGRFWAPYESGGLFLDRDPIDLDDERLRNLGRELAPAFMRVSGSWANATYFDVDGTTGGEPPEGFNGVLTRAQWDKANEFAMDLGLDVITSFAVSDGTRDESGVWTPDLARTWLSYTRDEGYPVKAAEFFNEPSLAVQGVPQGYDPQRYARDFEIFVQMVGETLPSLQIVGPGPIGEITPQVLPPIMLVEDIMAEISSPVEAFTYHFYPASSERCGVVTTPEDLLTLEYLSRFDADADHYESVRDEYEPGVPMWITETGQATCGGDRFAAQYVEALRYLDQLGRSAARGTAITMHNTLSASDYGLIDENGFRPRPAYWSAVLWQRLMGERVLRLAVENDFEDLRIYAHCTADGSPGSVSYLAINLSQAESRALGTGGPTDLYLLTGETLTSDAITLNGSVLEAAPDGTVGDLPPATSVEVIELPPTSIAYIVDTSANATACQ